MSSRATRVEQLYTDLHSSCVSFARKLVGPCAAEDVAQESFLRLLQYEIEPSRMEPAFVFTVVRNVAFNLHNEKRRRRAQADTLAEIKPGGPSSNDRHSWVLDLLPSLGPTQFGALMLMEVEGLTESQAGLALGVSRTTVGAARRGVVKSIRKRAAIKDGEPIRSHAATRATLTVA